MERRFVTLPPALTRVTGVNWEIDWREQSAGTGTGGRQNIQIGLLPRWVATSPLVVPPDLIGEMRARLIYGRGRLGLFKIRMIDPAVNRLTCGAGVPFGDGEYFAEGAGFDDYPVAECPAGAAAGATEIEISEAALAAPVAVGQILSYDDYPFAVTWRAALGGGLVRLGVEMPIRAAIPAGAPVEMIGRGVFEMLESGPGASYDLNRVARPVLRLQEWLR